MGGYTEQTYGLGQVPRESLDGPPRIAGDGPEGVACPNCGCGKTFLIQVNVKVIPVCGGRGTMTYVGCAACPWASPALIVGTR